MTTPRNAHRRLDARAHVFSQNRAHYQACVVRAKMRNGELAESTLLYGFARPELQSGGVGTVMINYLIQLCGKPPH
jgi:hypothetical protein